MNSLPLISAALPVQGSRAHLRAVTCCFQTPTSHNDGGNSCPAGRSKLSVRAVKVAARALQPCISQGREDVMGGVCRTQQPQSFFHNLETWVQALHCLTYYTGANRCRCKFHAWQHPAVPFTLNMANVTAAAPSTGSPCCAGGREDPALLLQSAWTLCKLKITPNPS